LKTTSVTFSSIALFGIICPVFWFSRQYTGLLVVFDLATAWSCSTTMGNVFTYLPVQPK